MLVLQESYLPFYEAAECFTAELAEAVVLELEAELEGGHEADTVGRDTPGTEVAHQANNTRVILYSSKYKL